MCKIRWGTPRKIGKTNVNCAPMGHLLIIRRILLLNRYFLQNGSFIRKCALTRFL